MEGYLMIKNKVIQRLITLSAITVLTAKLGRIEFNGHPETYYNLNMNRITARADAYYGLENVYAVREDGVKTYNGFVIVAADWTLHPYGTVIETSRGTGIVLDTHTAPERGIIDIAASW
jgi:3D (Asp-Asp-Asp) domain-containing protein